MPRIPAVNPRGWPCVALECSALIRIRVQGNKASELLARTAFLHGSVRKASQGKLYNSRYGHTLSGLRIAMHSRAAEGCRTSY